MNSIVMQHASNVFRLIRGHGECAQGTLANSWRRCALDHSMDPSENCSGAVLDDDGLEQRRTQHAELLRIASAEIDWLCDYLGASGYTVLLADASGIILYERTDAVLLDAFRSAGLRLGADWSEQREGTSGIGTCIAENRPTLVHRDEHFLARHIDLSSLGAPIRDPSGALVGVLSAASLNALSTHADMMPIMALLDRCSRSIERCLFTEHFRRGLVLRFHPRAEFVSLQSDGAIALAHDATIIAVDDTALCLLRAADRTDLVGRRIDEIFDIKVDELLDAAASGDIHLRPVLDLQLGKRFFATVDHATAADRSAPVPAPIRPQKVMRFVPLANRKNPLTLEELAGEDPQMLRNVRSAHRIASSRVPVMIQGPTGAGKEMFARALHAASDRAAHPFVALNCAAIPESLIESELFGYRSGAFTGARKEGMKGKILQSSGGTLFLDEIGDMPVALQTRLLRVLEEQEVIPLGTETAVKVDLRVVCASHQNLRSMISRGLFREDLYYRLNGITLELPPLAQRTDKERLIREFLAAETSDGRPAAIEMDAFDRLLAYAWPGNVRELRNVIRTALAICDGGVVRLRDLPSEVRSGEVAGREVTNTANADTTGSPALRGIGPGDDTSSRGSYRSAPVAREEVLRGIRECDGNMSRAAEKLGISRNTLYRHCKRLGIPPPRSNGMPD